MARARTQIAPQCTSTNPAPQRASVAEDRIAVVLMRIAAEVLAAEGELTHLSADSLSIPNPTALPEHVG